MSLCLVGRGGRACGFPRVSGDEPATIMPGVETGQFSLHEWGLARCEVGCLPSRCMFPT